MVAAPMANDDKPTYFAPNKFMKGYKDSLIHVTATRPSDGMHAMIMLLRDSSACKFYIQRLHHCQQIPGCKLLINVIL